jgi:hypothetical protein
MTSGFQLFQAFHGNCGWSLAAHSASASRISTMHMRMYVHIINRTCMCMRAHKRLSFERSIMELVSQESASSGEAVHSRFVISLSVRLNSLVLLFALGADHKLGRALSNGTSLSSYREKSWNVEK